MKTRPIRHALLAMLLVACSAPGLVTLGGCATAFDAPPGERPDDFGVLLTVYPTEHRTEPSLRPARYAVEPDGLLRAEVGNGVATQGFPPIARRLEPSELDTVYALTRDSGILADGAVRVPGTGVYEQPESGAVSVLEISINNRVRAYELPVDQNASVTPLIRELARLSWLDR